jgi:bacterial/archaeal transporter family-2 protein
MLAFEGHDLRRAGLDSSTLTDAEDHTERTGLLMDRGLAVILTAAAGGLIALQAPINAGLGRATGGLPAALVSFAVGTLALTTIVVLSGQAGGLGSTFGISWYYLLGGLLGAIYVANALIAVSTIGAGGVAAATVTGQLTASVVIDRLGLFGLDQVPLSAERLIGIALLLVGTVLIVR